MFFGRQTKQVAEKLSLQKELEFYEWEGDLSQLQRNVRSRLNRVASVRPPLTEATICLFVLVICAFLLPFAGLLKLMCMHLLCSVARVGLE
jgi:hypothetical protein